MHHLSQNRVDLVIVVFASQDIRNQDFRENDFKNYFLVKKENGPSQVNYFDFFFAFDLEAAFFFAAIPL